MRSYKRTDRIASLVKDAMSELLVFEVMDPRVHDAVVTHVHVTADMSIARIYVRSLVSDEQGKAELMAGLDACRGFIRSRLVQRVRLMRAPSLEFFYDEQEDEAARVDAILDRLSREKPGGSGA
jgi:ribosome-binding factor A